MNTPNTEISTVVLEARPKVENHPVPLWRRLLGKRHTDEKHTQVEYLVAIL